MNKFLYSLILFSHAFLAFAKDMDTIPVRGACLSYEIIGEGKPLIVLHGGPGMSHDYLMPQMGKLSEKYKVVFYDQRGSGASTGSENIGDLTVETFVEDLEAVRKHLGFEKISIIGHSWGGFLGMSYAAKHPKNVDRLIVLGTLPATSEDIGLFMQEWFVRMKPHMEKFESIKASANYKEGDPKTHEEFFRLMFCTYLADPRKLDDLNLKTSVQANLNMIKTNKAFETSLFSKAIDMTENLKKLTCKTLIVHGDVDPIPLSTAKHVHKMIPHSEMAVIENCGHFPYVEQPEQCFSILEEFLDRK